MIMSDIWIERQCMTTYDLQQEIDKVYEHGPLMARQHAREALRKERENWLGIMIQPFIKDSINKRVVNEGTTDEDVVKLLSYGLSSYSYDLRLARKVKIFTNVHASFIDPKNMNPACYVEMDVEGDSFLLPPNSYFLGVAMERLRIPGDVTAICLSKSTYARAGLVINTTLIDAGFQGDLVIEGSNSTTLPMRIYVEEGICQLAFFKGEQPCRNTYADKGGKYLHQEGVQDAKV